MPHREKDNLALPLPVNCARCTIRAVPLIGVMRCVLKKCVTAVLILLVFVSITGCGRSNERKDRELAYNNAEVRLRRHVEGGRIGYIGIEGFSRGQARLTPDDDYPPRDLTEEERARIKSAIEIVQTRALPEVPVLVLAQIVWREKSYYTVSSRDVYFFNIEVLTSHDNLVGFIVTERWPDGTQIKERYPVFIWPFWHETFKGEVHKTFSVYNYVSALGTDGLQLRTEDQRKSEDVWKRWKTTVAGGGEASKKIELPPFWISIPEQRQVFISVYDANGNVSQEVPLRFLSYPPSDPGEVLDKIRRKEL